MRVLIDTNIFIYREDSQVLPLALQQLLLLLNSLKIEILIHPRSIEEVESDKNKRRKEVVISKVRTYPRLESPPDPKKNAEFLKTVGQASKPHDEVDNWILFAVCKNAIDFLITEDKGIQRKSRRLKIRDRVLSVQEALETFNPYSMDDRIGHPVALKEEMVYSLDLADRFFDSLKQDYSEFEEWFAKISKEGRKCWVYYREDGTIGALLIFKEEDESIDGSDPPLPRGKRLKISTLKVEQTGFRLGELFIKMAVEFSIKRGLAEIYLTHFSKPNDELIALITQYGFFPVAKNKRGEDIFIKGLHPPRSKLQSHSPPEISRIFWPNFYDGSKVNKYVVPILPKFHNRLFTEPIKRQTLLLEHVGQFIIEGNTISKAYISSSRISTISPGDILLFYRSTDLHEITTLGVVEEVYPGIQDKDTVIRLVRKRTVYTIREVEHFLEKPTLVILFNWHLHLPNPLKLGDLKKMKVLKTAPQTFTKISHERYIRIKDTGGIDARFTIN